MATNNAINLKSAGVVSYDAAGAFTGTAITQHNVLVAGASNIISSVAPGTSGNVLTSDGTDWTSAAASGGGVLTSTGSITWSNANLKAGTSLKLVDAAGAGIVIVPVSVVFKFIYGGTNAFTNLPTSQINYGSTEGTAQIMIGPTSADTFWEATANEYLIIGTPSGTRTQGTRLAATDCENTAVYATLSGALTGNAAANNVVHINLVYYTVTL